MKTKLDWKEWASGLAILLLVMMWTYAALSKLWELERFVDQLELVPFGPVKMLAPVMGWLVPLSELLIVVLLCRDRTRDWGCRLSIGLLLAFELYISLLMASGRRLPCTCGGLISRLQWREHLVFNAVFILLALLPLLWRRKF